MLVIGGGAAGMMCAITAAEAGAKVVVLERNDKIGRKLYITGKGRCNVTNDTTGAQFAANIVTNAAFMRGALARFDSRSTQAFFEESGVPLKVERGNRVFPSSDKSTDIIDALLKRAKAAGVTLHTGVRVTSIERTAEGFSVMTTEHTYNDRIVVVATGGATYKACGSTGDGYGFAQSVGHTVVPAVGALCALRVQGTTEYSGLTLKNVQLTMQNNDKVVYDGFGELLYTHTGLSGPLALSASSYINRLPAGSVTAVVDMKPAVSAEELERRLLTDFGHNPNKQLINVVHGYLPKALLNDWLSRAGVLADKPVNAVTKEERRRLAATLKRFVYTVDGLEDMDGAIVTGGGISVKEVNPKTMESKICEGLYWAGEVLDVDCLTGGFNLQIAFATGYCAGIAAAQKEREYVEYSH